jgi:hypothetical protein
MLEGQVDAVIGVDTHRDSHAAAVPDPNGGLRATLEVPSDHSGHARLFQLAEVQAPGRRVWALEGTGCYGAGLTRFLVNQGEWVVEIDRPTRPRGRHGAKSDALDAIRAGREALARDHQTTPRQRGHREALRVLHTTRAGIVQAGADARRQLKALIVTAPEPLRDRLRGRPWRQQLRACAELVALLVLAACAPGANDVAGAGGGDLAGFWLGLWHRIIAPVTFIISLFNDHVNLYEVHNNGNWYNFGFVLGLSVVFGSGARASARARRSVRSSR